MDENFGWLFQLLAYFLAAFSSARRLVRATWASIRTLQMYVQSDGGHGATSTSEDAEEIEASLAEYLAIFSCNEASSVIKSRSQNTETAAVSQPFLGHFSAVSRPFCDRTLERWAGLRDRRPTAGLAPSIQARVFVACTMKD